MSQLLSPLIWSRLQVAPKLRWFSSRQGSALIDFERPPGQKVRAHGDPNVNLTIQTFLIYSTNDLRPVKAGFKKRSEPHMRLKILRERSTVRLLLSAAVLMFSISSMALNYSDVTAQDRASLEPVLVKFLIRYKNAVEIAEYNIKRNTSGPSKFTENFDTLRLTTKTWPNIAALFADVGRIVLDLPAYSDIQFARDRGQQRLVSLAKESSKANLLVMELSRTPADPALLSKSLDQQLMVESYVAGQSLSLVIPSLNRAACETVATVNQGKASFSNRCH